MSINFSPYVRSVISVEDILVVAELLFYIGLQLVIVISHVPSTVKKVLEEHFGVLYLGYIHNQQCNSQTFIPRISKLPFIFQQSLTVRSQCLKFLQTRVLTTNGIVCWPRR